MSKPIELGIEKRLIAHDADQLRAKCLSMPSSLCGDFFSIRAHALSMAARETINSGVGRQRT